MMDSDHIEFLKTSEYAVCSASPGIDCRTFSFDQGGVVPSIKDGTYLMFTADAAIAWLGCCGDGLTTSSCVVETFSPLHCCVVAGGQCYLVDVKEPTGTIAIPGGDVVECVRCPEYELVLLVSLIDITGMQKDGTWWRSERVASDEIRNITIGEGVVRGEGWRADAGEWTAFMIDARTGRSV